MTSATSTVKGASVSSKSCIVLANHAATSFGSVRRPLRSNTINSLIANRRQPSFIPRICQRLFHAAAEALRFECAPEPDVRVEKRLHREASQSSQLPVGPTMSPMILPVPTLDPSRLPVVSGGDGGITSATSLAKRVTRMGLRVLRTSSKMPRQDAEALGLELRDGDFFHVYRLYRCQRPWANDRKQIAWNLPIVESSSTLE